MSGSAPSTRILRERDLYVSLLELGQQEALEPLLREALKLIVDVTGARQGYLQVQDPLGDDDAVWWMQHGFSGEELTRVRAALSQGILGEAIATGKTICTPSALLDPRFRERSSVRMRGIEAVLCTPINRDPPIGALYLQGREQPGQFTEEDARAAEIFTRQLAPLADRLIVRRRAECADDPTRELRRQLACNGVVGRSPALAQLLRQVAMVAPLDVSVLLTGESGTGKSQIARLIHDNGPRSRQPFVEINCANLPENLIESELFGALPGAHSTANRRIEGKVAAAEQGTLFLDEVSELAWGVQAKLLQLLQSKEYYPLGGTRPVRADVRIVAATNGDLEQAVRERRFREDLFYRLRVLPVRVPSLAERAGDVRALAMHFAERACQRHGLPHLQWSPGALRALEQAEWPGNVRQLAHLVESAAIQAAGQGAMRIERSHLFPEPPVPDDATETSRPLTFQDATRRFQARFLADMLREYNWNVVETAKRLDLARSYVYQLINAFGLERPPRR